MLHFIDKAYLWPNGTRLSWQTLRFQTPKPKGGVFPNTIPVGNTKYDWKLGDLVIMLEQANCIWGVMLYYCLT